MVSLLRTYENPFSIFFSDALANASQYVSFDGVCVHSCMLACICVYLHVFVYVCVYLCMCACVLVFIYVQAWLYRLCVVL